MRFVGIPIDGITSPSVDSKHQFWDNRYPYFNVPKFLQYYDHINLKLPRCFTNVIP